MDNSTNNDKTSKPWYKQPWLWFVISIPLTSVILSSIMVTVAVIGKDSMVTDNYYKDGMGINQTIEQDQRADQLNLKPYISITEKSVVLKFDPSNTLFELQPFLTLKLFHPTISERDITIKLLPTPDKVYLGDIEGDIIGKRYLDLVAFDESWRIREEINLPISRHALNQSQQTQDQ